MSVLYYGFLAELEAEPIIFLILSIKSSKYTKDKIKQTVVIDLNTDM